MGNSSDFNIPLISLADGEHHWQMVCDAEFFSQLERPGILSAEVKVDIDLVKKHGAYDCTLHCLGEVEVPCDLCLDPLAMPVDATYNVIIKHGQERAVLPDDSRDGLLIVGSDATSVDLAEIVADTILLDLPVRRVHTPGECNPEMSEALGKYLSPSQQSEEDENPEIHGDEDTEEE